MIKISVIVLILLSSGCAIVQTAHEKKCVCLERNIGRNMLYLNISEISPMADGSFCKLCFQNGPEMASIKNHVRNDIDKLIRQYLKDCRDYRETVPFP